MRKIVYLMVGLVIILSACGTNALEEDITLMNQSNEAVSFPADKPVLFFFITTYT